MTDEERAEGTDDPVEDLEAPAEAQSVSGGKNSCAAPTCVGNTKVVVDCLRPTCMNTASGCTDDTGTVTVYER